MSQFSSGFSIFLFACINGFNDNTEFYLIVLLLQKPGGVIALLDEAWYA